MPFDHSECQFQLRKSLSKCGSQKACASRCRVSPCVLEMKSHTNHTNEDAELVCESGRPNWLSAKTSAALTKKSSKTGKFLSSTFRIFENSPPKIAELLIILDIPSRQHEVNQLNCVVANFHRQWCNIKNLTCQEKIYLIITGI